MLVPLKKLKLGDKFRHNGNVVTFKGWCKEKHWYWYELPNYGTYHIDTKTSDLQPLHNMLVEKIEQTNQLTLF